MSKATHYQEHSSTVKAEIFCFAVAEMCAPREVQKYGAQVA